LINTISGKDKETLERCGDGKENEKDSPNDCDGLKNSGKKSKDPT